MDGVRYRLVVEGELGPRFATLFEGMSISYLDGNTVVVATIVDQAQLQGLLDRLAGLGVKLISLTPADT